MKNEQNLMANEELMKEMFIAAEREALPCMVWDDGDPDLKK